MDVAKITPPSSSFLQVKLDKKTIDYLWKIIEVAKSKEINHKNKLIGNISKSLLLNDQDSYFYQTVCMPLVKFYRQNNHGFGDPILVNTKFQSNTKLVLDEMWVNYQYKTEFNPYHDHCGVYSFAIWLRIPYDWKDQYKLPQFNGMEQNSKKPGNFEFEYIDSLGGIRNFVYKLNKDLEGTMLFFPAKLRHCVYPFYEINEPRISIAGNLIYSIID